MVNLLVACNWVASAKGLSTIGLIFDLIGISILFFFQVDRNHSLRETGAVTLIAEQDDQGEIKKWALYRKLTVAGFILLILGFALQIAGNLCS